MSASPRPVALTVPGSAEGDRLDRFLASAAAGFDPPLSRARVQTLIRAGRVRRNQQPVVKPSEPLQAADLIVVEDLSPVWPADPGTPPAAQPIGLVILHEDDDLLVLDKPAGLVVHPAPGHPDHTLVNALRHHCGPALSGLGGTGRPGIVHRLDKDTSGCVVVAKTDAAHAHLSAQFSGRTTEKLYLALVRGVPSPPAGLIDAPVGRHPVHRQKMAVRPADDRPGRRPGPARAAQTRYRVVRTFPARPDRPAASLLECRLLTGRTHQIRVHLQSLGCPVLGDALYGGAAGRLAARQLLHAWKLAFDHPRTGRRLRCTAPPPADFLAFDPRPLLP